jgi:hypothetical protein
MIALLLAVGAVSIGAGCIYLAEVWEMRERARRRHHALQSFYDRESPRVRK